MSSIPETLQSRAALDDILPQELLTQELERNFWWKYSPILLEITKQKGLQI
jgi:hypothetical protein